jgi:uncharacterized protein (TIGR03435 family)
MLKVKLAALALWPAALLAQTQTAPPKFDVISVKPCHPGVAPDAGGGRGEGGSKTARFHLPCGTVKNLILQAYYGFADGRRHPPPFPPIEGPSWIDSARYVIDATTEGTVSREVMNGPMLQALLEDRFQLRLRRETRDAPGYALTAAKGGPKLKPFQAGDCVDLGFVTPLAGPAPQYKPGDRPVICGKTRGATQDAGNVVWDVPGTTLEFFTKTYIAMAFWDRPVVDKTGIGGLFDIHLEFTPDETTAGPPDSPRPPAEAGAVPGPTLFIALQQQLGLKLEPVKAPREFLVVDSIQRPTDN